MSVVYIVQSLLLVIGTYFLGSWIGCMLRRMVSGRGDAVDTAASAAAVATATATQAHDRFGRALAGADTTERTPAPAPGPAGAFEPTAPRIETIPERTQPAPISRRASESERLVTATPIVTPGNDTVAADVEVGQPIHAAIAVAAATVVPTASPSATTAGVEHKIVGAAPSGTPPMAAADDLTAIRGVGNGEAELLQRHGFATYSRIAAMTSDDVARIEGVLGTDGRISRENWIEQAGLLAAGVQSAFVRQRAAASARVSPIEVSGPRVAVEQALDQPTPARADGPDELTLVRGIDGPALSALQSAGVTRFAQIAAWTKTDVHRFDALLGSPGRIARENWIEQAGMLATGKQTQHARLVQHGATTTTARAGADEGQPLVIPAASVVTAGLAAAAAAAAAAGIAASASATKTGRAITDRDDLTRIAGITPELEKMLNARGLTRFAQLAALAPADVARIEGYIGASGRMQRENWLSQARALAGLPEQDDNGADAASTVAGLAGLRSVRSAAYVAPSGVTPSGVAGRPAASGPMDDLKRIRGVGVLIEKKLRMLGVTTYEQIANWTSADIDRVSQHLDFRGRIERENWVEQARILVSGGETQFSRRFDSQAPGTGTPSDEV